MIQINETISGECEKRHLLDRRDDIDILRMRAEMVFKGRHLAMINLYYGRGATCREIAALIGRSESQTLRILSSLTDKLSDDRSISFIRNPDKFTSAEKELISAHLFDGLSFKKTAMKHGCTIHRVRAAISKLEKLS
jgi:DNA-binding CsgD family transcriptional regulator